MGAGKGKALDVQSVHHQREKRQGKNVTVYENVCQSSQLIATLFFSTISMMVFFLCCLTTRIKVSRGKKNEENKDKRKEKNKKSKALFRKQTFSIDTRQ